MPDDPEEEVPPDDARPPSRPVGCLDPNTAIVDVFESLKKSGENVKLVTKPRGK